MASGLGRWRGFGGCGRPRARPRWQIAESVAGRRRIGRHVWSARNEAELGLLIEQGHQLLADDGQGVLDLDLSPAVRRATLIGRPAPQALFGSEPLAVSRVACALVVKTSSKVLFDALAGVCASLGFDTVGNAVFRDLVIARVVEPTSLSDVDRVAEMGRRSVSLSTRKRNPAPLRGP